MANNTSPDIRQSQTRVLQDQLNSTAVVQMDSTLASINNELTAPGRLIAQATPSLVVTIGSGTVVNPNTSKNRTFPLLNNVAIPFTGGTITFPSAAGGGTITPSAGTSATITIGASQYCAVLVQLDVSGNINMTVGTPASSLGAVVVPGGSTSFLSLGYIIVQSNASSVIQSITNAMIYQFTGGGGAGGGSGSGTGDDLDSLLFRASFGDLFPESPTISTSSINLTGTNATYSSAKNMYTVNYDASKTATAPSTTVTMSAAPSFTVAVGDVVVSGGYARKITAVASQTSYTIEAAFPTALSASACCVSQCVYTKDIYNFAVDGVALSAGFSGSTFNEVMVDYKDNATSGSNLWTPNTTPFIAFVASPDNTNFTTQQVRATNETDTAGDTLLPSYGTSLYLRFFSNATSGSGTANLIAYKAFMQKSANAAGGGVLNSAYAFTNGVGTPINCSVGLSGGKTTITLTWSYAVGVNSTAGTGGRPTPYGSVDVYLNGQMIPRFIDSTLTPDASYTETSSTIITLDRNYSQQNLSIEVLQRTQIVDASTQNSTSLSYLQEINNQGFNAFVNTQNVRTATTTTGTPAAGTFYSSITNRANIVDISQDLRASFGIERIMTQQIVQLQTESGPNGEPVWSTPNDTNGLIRFIGNWTIYDDNNGQHPYTPTTTDSVEVTFYGTGLNLLTNPIASMNYGVTVDGVTGTSVTTPSSSSAILGLRNYSSNIIIPIVSGLTLGVHTVRLINTSGAMSLFGFEILNLSSTINVNPGISYSNGQKLTAASATALNYNSTFDSGTLGTAGGHVVVYQKADGTIGKAVTPASGTPLYLTNASHSNEEIARQYSFREFGAGRSDDFSLGFSAGSNLAFTLDDGTTTLVGSLVNYTTGAKEGVFPSTNAGFLTFTFVGTGLDVVIAANAGTTYSTTYTVTVDGTAILTAAAASSFFGRTTQAGIKIVKICSGLNYGTHTVRIACPSVGTGDIFNSFIVYQPKTPALPVGATLLADYNILANFVANTVGTQPYISTGVIRKSCVREMMYNGSFSTSVATNNGSGWQIVTSTAGNTMSYTFFGTGFDFRMNSASSTSSITVAVDGSSNFSAFTTSAYGNAIFVAATGALSVPNTVQDGGLVINGLTLGLHTVVFTHNSNNMDIDCLDIITPVYSAKSNTSYDVQNTLLVGSNALSDNRKTSPIASVSAKKNISQAFGITSSPTTTSTTAIPMPDMNVVHTNSSGRIKISYGCVLSNNTSTDIAFVQIYVDGIAIGNAKEYQAFTSGGQGSASDCFMISVSPGVRQIALYWYGSGGTSTANNTQRNLLVEEV